MLSLIMEPSSSWGGVWKKSKLYKTSVCKFLFQNCNVFVTDCFLEFSKKEYLKIKAEYEEDPSKPIEVKGNDVRESMQDILSKLDIRNIKDERDLLALFLAYKDGENLYDKRV